jgi:hypothetical protein
VPASPLLVTRLVADLRLLTQRASIDGNRHDQGRLPLAVPSLDALLGGGLPRGAITEIFGGLSSGRTTFAHLLTSAATRAGEFAAWIDLPNALDPEGAALAGVDLERVLWVAPTDRVAALRAVEHVLDAEGFRIVIIDLDGVPLSRLVVSTSAWMRMARAAVRRNAAIVTLSAAHVAGAFATLSLEVHPRRRIFLGKDGPCPVFEGATTSFHVRKYKFGSADHVPIELFASARL